jgi:excisionase family DNA binding protein
VVRASGGCRLAEAFAIDWSYLIIYYHSVQYDRQKEGRVLEDVERLSLREAANALGISEVTARRWIKSGKLRASQPGRKYLIPRSAVDELLDSDSGKAHAPESPREWLRAHNAILLSLTEDELKDHYAALYPGDSVKFSDRIDSEWGTIKTARAVSPLPSPEMMRKAMALAESRYLQAKELAPISTSYDPDDPEKPEQVTLRSERLETPARSGRKDRSNTG